MTSPKASPLWTPAPQKGFGERPNIVRVEPGRMLTFVCLSPRCEGAIVHWDGRRTVACTGDETCTVDHAATKRRWQGWLAVQAVNGIELLFLPVTEGAARDNPQLTDPQYDLRGMELRVWRTNSKANGELAISFGVNLYKREMLMDSPDLREFCRRLWGFSPEMKGFTARRTGRRPMLADGEDCSAVEPPHFGETAGSAGDHESATKLDPFTSPALCKPKVAGPLSTEVARQCKERKPATREQIKRLKGGK